MRKKTLSGAEGTLPQTSKQGETHIGETLQKDTKTKTDKENNEN